MLPAEQKLTSRRGFQLHLAVLDDDAEVDGIAAELLSKSDFLFFDHALKLLGR
jgi:hypothetical protein